MKIIHLIAKKSTVNLDICRIYYPEISSGTFHSTLSKLVKHGLVRKDSQNNQLTTYAKTNEFTVEKAASEPPCSRNQETTILTNCPRHKFAY